MLASLFDTYHWDVLQKHYIMNTSAQHISEQLKEIINVNTKTCNGVRVVQHQVEEGEKLLNPGNTSSILDTVLSTINNKFAPECIAAVVRLLNAHPVCQSKAEWVSAKTH